jgi:glycerol-3-phosphate dehydrogenase
MDRAANLGRLSDSFDIAIIGGGATGLGTAVDAAARGLKVVLLEARDFASGTSSRSTKLVHGGVRYLAQGNVSLVREALRERGRLRRNAPHLVGDLEFVVPAYAYWSGSYYGVGLKLYDVLAGKKFRLGKSQFISKAEVLTRVPNVEPEQLRGGIVYHDGQFDDARLAVALAQTADSLGAVVLNYARVLRLEKTSGKLSGLVFRDAETGSEHEVRAKVVVNATGVFADGIAQLDDEKAEPRISPSQGVHLVLPRELFPGSSALMVPKTDDGRVLFMVPWHGSVLLGTTDTPVPKVVNEPHALEEEVAFLLTHAARYLEKDPTRADVRSVYVGLRPLVKASKGEGKTTGSLSRDHALFVSESGLITIVGGKWTTYRKMAEDTVDRALLIGALKARPCSTGNLRLYGAPEAAKEALQSLDSSKAQDLLAIYGTEAEKIRALAREDAALARPLHPRLPYVAAEVAWAVRREMARTVEDALSRRTRALVLDAGASAECAPAVAALMAKLLGRGEGWQRDQLAAFRQRCKESQL